MQVLVWVVRLEGCRMSGIEIHGWGWTMKENLALSR